ncbi:2-succinyl-5-enolpyruvyl-6-hydroxy-3-cyclohexene-1-carboxylic-acid synthase [Kineosporia sp. NBRC 101731]|uniref:2-succinyl-5-enolpyruvyl-6-hydroxy-3- cyclohexene-1-carboxylic-acid synthase n=1 Tax=Kineosporia sp. NBRC 101731 TaxID=3032199 RepID=UPI0024A4B3B3|nr:2-succinyl-5-enolpyruvyl-6-hydroxy-3-cyclohexene-1-carboxylic-acid synthase [Kineosporia sp. NBRC 101731]GLY27608.1 2-succinyl-5-enolpyruvyl-6-hydroxy-3-cyclohexene-1-carboxylate synthase [Kineosporia sp. NBRC 101731]
MNPSTALATVLVDSLARLGVRHVVLCPGSRSAPLAYALAEAADAGTLDLHVRIDERTAAFLALGLARGSGVPAAVVTTSGTAVANLHPAVLEAAHSGVPLLVLSADRPHELRGTGASQTTDQVKLFGSAVRWFGEIPAPTGHRAGQVAGWRNVTSRAVAAARGLIGHAPGPVQLNIGFAEPLTPDEGEPGPWPEQLVPDAPATTTSSAGIVPGLTSIPEPAPPAPFVLASGPRTVVLAGDGAGPEAAHLATRAHWPLLAEPSSGVRDSTTAAPYRLLLGTQLGEKIERVIVFGRPTLSRPVTRLLSSRTVEIIVVSPRPDWSDAGRLARIVVPAVTVADHRAHDETWLSEWLSAAQETEKAIGAVIDDEERLTGQLVAREIAGATGPDDLLFSGSSNPIRDLDLVARIPHGAQLMANRGLAGIDGTISTAIGAALASGRTTRLLLGDLTFLHDANALLLGPGEPRPNLQIVVVDDHGGGIFATLEHGARAERGETQNRHYERVFGTPQEVDLEALARGYGVAYARVADAGELEARLTSSIIGISLLHVEIDRTRHRELTDKLRRAIGASG